GPPSGEQLVEVAPGCDVLRWRAGCLLLGRPDAVGFPEPAEEDRFPQRLDGVGPLPEQGVVLPGRGVLSCWSPSTTAWGFGPGRGPTDRATSAGFRSRR